MNMTSDPDERPLSSLNSSGSTPGALYGVVQHGKGPTSRSSTHTAQHPARPQTHHRYGERHDFQTYINMNYLLATWPTAPAAV